MWLNNLHPLEEKNILHKIPSKNLLCKLKRFETIIYNTFEKEGSRTIQIFQVAAISQ